jgi:tetratricopeptide (TPR) repeat protein
MPKRSRSHELEELSVARFSDLLPSKWVSRPKLPDYGIDREIEIFDADGESTGLMFLVQLRATDDPRRANLVRLETDEAKYYHKLDLPVAIARYCSATNDFYWQWASVITSKTKISPDQTTFTYHFGEGERWTSVTPIEIERRLAVRRALASFPAGAAMPVRLNLERLPAVDRYVVERAMTGAIAQSAGALIRVHDAVRPVEVLVSPEPQWLSVQIDTVTSVTFDFPEANADDIVTSTFYALARLFQRNKLQRQAEAVARVILARGRAHQSEDLAFTACQALAADLSALVDLAIINRLHYPTNQHYAPLMLIMMHGPKNTCAFRDAVDRFFKAALASVQEDGATENAAVHYSIANFYGKVRPCARSMQHYNCARRLRPAYLKAGYFLREIAGLLFRARHYSWAAKAYQAAIEIRSEPILSFLLGDALMFSGQVTEARRHFEDAVVQGVDGVMLQETVLKQLTCSWLLDKIGAERLPRRRREADGMMRPDGHDNPETLDRVITEVDSFNPLARFNLGVFHSQSGDPREALGNFLVCAFVQSGDVAAWANAAICALSLNEDVVFLAILSVAIARAGPEAYDRLRADLVSQGAQPEIIMNLDNVVLALIGDANASSEKNFTMRILMDDRYEEVSIPVY